MLMGIYKPGQGYWTRVLTAIGAAICFGAFALWAWQQAALIPIPTPTYTLSLGQVDGTIEAGDIVTFRRDAGDGSVVEMGGGVVREVGGEQATVVVSDVEISDPEFPISEASSLEVVDGPTSRVTSVRGIPIFEPLYLQAAIAGVIVIIGAVVTYYYVGTNRRSTEFLIATDNEMKKVNWSTWKDIRGSTLVVIAASFLMASGLFGVDMFFSFFFKWVGVLTN